MSKKYRVIIPPTSRESLRDIVRHIKKDSPSSAIRVKKKLIEIAKSLEFLPERFSKELYLAEKDGNYRSVTQWHFKIIYRVLNEEVLILRFMHTSKDPDETREID